MGLFRRRCDRAVAIVLLLISIFGICATTLLAETASGSNSQSKREGKSTVTGKNRRATKFLNGFEKNTQGLDNHEMSRDELKDYLRNELGSEHFDDESEVAVGVDEAFSNLDVGRDGTISLSEMTTFWGKLTSLKSVDDVVDWVKYSVQLPQYEKNFRENAITGYDLPTLLENGGEVLRADLGVANRLHRKIILRGITTRLLGIGKLPLQMNNVICTLLPNCNGVQIDWAPITHAKKTEAAEKNIENSGQPVATVESLINAAEKEAQLQEQVPVHLYRFKRVVIEKKDNSSEVLLLNKGYDKDRVIKNLPFLDESANKPGSIYRFKAQSWNLFGASTWTKHIDCPPVPPTCAETLAKRKASNEKRVTHFMNKIEWTTEGSNDLEIRREELNEFIRENLGKSENFDEDTEVSTSVENAFDNMDIGGDGVISRADITAFWAKMKGLQTVNDVVDWVKYGLQLRQYEDTFRSNSITGDVLPTLLIRKQFVKSTLKITNELHILHFRTSLKARLLGLHEIPDTVQLKRCKSHCDRFEVFWQSGDSNSEGNTQALKPHSYQIQERLSRINKWDDYIVSSFDDRSFSSTSYVRKEGDGTVEFRIRAWNNFGSSDWSEVMPCPQRPKTCAQIPAYDDDGAVISDAPENIKSNRSRPFLSHLFDLFTFFKDLYIWAYIVFTAYLLYTHKNTVFELIDQQKKKYKIPGDAQGNFDGTGNTSQSTSALEGVPTGERPIIMENVARIEKGGRGAAGSAKKLSAKRCQIAGCTKRNKVFNFNRCQGLRGTFYRNTGERECQRYFCKDHTGIAKYPHFICSECFNIGIQRFKNVKDVSKIDPLFKDIIKKIHRERKRDE